jgi:hypothetical protein
MNEKQEILVAVFRHTVEAGDISLGRLLQLLAGEFGPEDIQKKALVACELLAKAGAIEASDWYEGELAIARNTLSLPASLREAVR